MPLKAILILFCRKWGVEDFGAREGSYLRVKSHLGVQWEWCWTNMYCGPTVYDEHCSRSFRPEGQGQQQGDRMT